MCDTRKQPPLKIDVLFLLEKIFFSHPHGDLLSDLLLENENKVSSNEHYYAFQSTEIYYSKKQPIQLSHSLYFRYVENNKTQIHYYEVLPPNPYIENVKVKIYKTMGYFTFDINQRLTSNSTQHLILKIDGPYNSEECLKQYEIYEILQNFKYLGLNVPIFNPILSINTNHQNYMMHSFMNDCGAETIANYTYGGNKQIFFSDELLERNKQNQLIFKLMLGCCYAVDQFHSKNYLHCDIKDANFCVNDEMRVVLIDFNDLKIKDYHKRPEYKSFTAHGGTEAYLAPETDPICGAATKPITQQAEIFSTGVVLTRLYTQLDVNAANVANIVDTIKNSDMQNLLRSMIHSNPQERVNAIKKVIHQLERMQKILTSKSSSKTTLFYVPNTVSPARKVFMVETEETSSEPEDSIKIEDNLSSDNFCFSILHLHIFWVNFKAEFYKATKLNHLEKSKLSYKL